MPSLLLLFLLFEAIIPQEKDYVKYYFEPKPLKIRHANLSFSIVRSYNIKRKRLCQEHFGISGMYFANVEKSRKNNTITH